MDKPSRAQLLASALLNMHIQPSKETRGTGWTAVYELERLFGVAEDSPWKSVADAVKHCALSPWPAPMARYEMAEHAIHVFNGDLLTRVVKLRQFD